VKCGFVNEAAIEVPRSLANNSTSVPIVAPHRALSMLPKHMIPLCLRSTKTQKHRAPSEPPDRYHVNSVAAGASPISRSVMYTPPKIKTLPTNKCAVSLSPKIIIAKSIAIIGSI
jgi:hypothetical protein